MNELTPEAFTRLVVQKIEELGLNVLLNNPDTEATYPCVVIGDIYSSEKHTNNLIPILTKYQISIEVWDTKKYDVMSNMYNITVKLRDLNISPSGSDTFVFDEVTNKHREVKSFEVFYNGFMDAFVPTKY